MGEPETTAHYNFTDPDSWILEDRGNERAFVQGYNAQAAVNATSQVTVMAAITQESPDQGHLGLMVQEMEWELGQLPPMRGTSVRRRSARASAEGRGPESAVPSVGPQSSGMG